MTTILPSARTPWDVIGQQIGQNVSQNLPGAVEQGMNRQRGLNAIDQLQNALKDSNGDMSKILPAIAKAYTQNPSLERSGIAEKFIPLIQRQQGAKDKDFTPGGHPTRQGEKPETQVPVSVSDLVPPRPGMVSNPQGLNDFQLPYGPEDIANIRQQARAKGYLPEIEERFVNDAQEYNKIAEQRRASELSNYQQQQQQRRDTLENQQKFEKYIVDHDPEFAKNPDELELANKASEKYQNVPSFAERNAKVKEELRPYQAAKNALKKTLTRPLFGQTKEQRDAARPRAQFMVEMGQKPQLQLMIANGGFGDIEEADLLNPLPENVEKSLSSMSKFTNPFEKVTSTDPESPEYMKQLEKGTRARLKQKENAVDYLSSAINAGDYKHPGTNLVLSRYHLMKNGASWEEAQQIIDEAIKKAGIQLDPQQKIDSQKLGYPPLTGETYSDTVLNNVLFPITGRQ